MAAGLSVVIPLVCVLVIQLRKAKREERERERRSASQEAAESGSESTSGPPPTYEQLFGPGHEAVPAPALHSRHSSTDVLIQEHEVLAGTDGGQGNSVNLSQGHGAVTVSHANDCRNDNNDEAVGRGRHGRRGGEGGGRERRSVSYSPNQRIRRASVSAICGSEVEDFTLSSTSSESSLSTMNARRAQELYLTVARLNSGTDSRWTPQTSGPDSENPATIVQSSSNPSPSVSSTSLTTTTTIESVTTPSSLSPSTSPGRLASLDNVDHQRPSEDQCPPSSTYRHPGMHISLEEFLTSYSYYYDNEMDGPPPSYEEALKILEKAEQANG